MKYEYVECFNSIEGEAKYTGISTIYIRLTKCNFTCSKFNNPDNVDPSSHEVLGFNPGDIPTVTDIPQEISVGCDSIYAWHKDFKHMWTSCDENELAQTVTDLLPPNRDGDWSNDILSLTGGEPTLRQKTIPTLLSHPLFDTLKHVLIETNCSVPINDKFIADMTEWVQAKPGRLITWSNSPKLSASGESYEKAIRPDIATRQLEIPNTEQYFKFVCDAKQEHFDEVEKAMQDYWDGGVPKQHNVYIMPVSCTEEQQRQIMTQVADECLLRGMIYCHRVHNTVYDNAIGK